MPDPGSTPGADGTTRIVQLAPGEAGQRLDQALTRLLDGPSRVQVQRWIRGGRVRIANRVVRRVSQPLEAGLPVRVDVPAPVDTSVRPQPIPLAILYEDADLLVVDKPAGLVVHPAAGHPEDTLVNALLHHVGDLSGIGGERRPGIVHRLDKGTSGVLLVAKHDRAHTALAGQFKARTVEKTYLALAWGSVPVGTRMDAAIGRHPTERRRMSVRARRSRSALTEVLASEPLPPLTLVRLRIATGRTHQIRVHLGAIGHPVVGDALYGGTRRRWPPDLGFLRTLERPFLHAAEIAFDHPATGERVAFAAPLPADLQTIVDRLRQGTRP